MKPLPTVDLPNPLWSDEGSAFRYYDGGVSDIEGNWILSNHRGAGVISGRCHGRGSCGQSRKRRRATLRSASPGDRAAFRSWGRGADEGRSRQDFDGLRRVEQRAWPTKSCRHWARGGDTHAITRRGGRVTGR
jgi:hypothetical protein